MNRVIHWFGQLRQDLGSREHKALSTFLRFIIVEKAIKSIVLFVLAFSIFPIFSAETVLLARQLARQSHLFSNARFVTSFIRFLNQTREQRLLLFSIFFLGWGLLELVEAVGIFKRRRWAEYLAVVTASLFIPIEIRTVAIRFTMEKLGFLVFNIILVYYFIHARHLFRFHR
ncbi:DUF2127 domain-containing protein [Candidatus Gottesmanbacteria bacterium]|nr:DUF2127 domain-containing protein [Candidatus Gottesmanbacteria bacterium]